MWRAASTLTTSSGREKGKETIDSLTLLGGRIDLDVNRGNVRTDRAST
jgi:hypothetical protein